MNRFQTSLLSQFPSLIIVVIMLLLLSGCQSFSFRSADSSVKNTQSLPIPLAKHEFTINGPHDEVVGALQVIKASSEDTLSDIARRFNLGYEEIVAANPNVDPWLPGEGTQIVIPTQFVLPDAPRQGIVINLAAMRLFYYPQTKNGEPQRVITHPVGIGRVEWKTPEGMTKVAAKKENPSWIPTPAIRKEHAANGDPLPAVVPPGPDNPMGTHVLKLAWPSYAIHGTDKPPSIGLRGSHGCLRMYPEDIIGIYQDVPVGTPVRVVNQPWLLGWRNRHLYLQAYPTLEDDKRNHQKLVKTAINTALASPKAKLNAKSKGNLNLVLATEATKTPRAIAMPITQPELSLLSYLGRATRVQNVLPFNATWDGDMKGQLTAVEVKDMANR